jgi:hypothetical protein
MMLAIAATRAAVTARKRDQSSTKAKVRSTVRKILFTWVLRKRAGGFGSPAIAASDERWGEE